MKKNKVNSVNIKAKVAQANTYDAIVIGSGMSGGFWGAKRLPSEMTQTVITTNKSLGIDIEALAASLANKILEHGNS